MPGRERRANHVREPSRRHPIRTQQANRRLLIGREEEDLPQGGVAGQEAGGSPELPHVREAREFEKRKIEGLGKKCFKSISWIKFLEICSDKQFKSYYFKLCFKIVFKMNKR